MSLFFFIYEIVNKLLIQMYLKPETNKVTTAGTVSLVSAHQVRQTRRINLHHVALAGGGSVNGFLHVVVTVSSKLFSIIKIRHDVIGFLQSQINPQ